MHVAFFLTEAHKTIIMFCGKLFSPQSVSYEAPWICRKRFWAAENWVQQHCCRPPTLNHWWGWFELTCLWIYLSSRKPVVGPAGMNGAYCGIIWPLSHAATGQNWELCSVHPRTAAVAEECTCYGVEVLWRDSWIMHGVAVDLSPTWAMHQTLARESILRVWCYLSFLVCANFQG